MNESHLIKFQVENFKRFERFEMDNLGQFNLIVGDNNVGKTSVLEALLVDENPKKFFHNLISALMWRKLMPVNPVDFEFSFLDSYINKSGNRTTIEFVIETSNQVTKKIIIEPRTKGSFSNDDLQNSDLNLKFIQFSNSNYWAKFSINDKTNYEQLFDFSSQDGDFVYIPFIPFNLGFETDLVSFFSKYIQISTTTLINFIKELQLFIPEVTGMEVFQQSTAFAPTLIVRRKNIDYTLPLTQMGSGAVNFVRILIELVVCRNKRLMIDEIDSGIHHSKMKNYLKAIMTAAKQNNVQIFATTHSAECIKYYKEALEELEDGKYKDDARIIHLHEIKDKSIKAYSYKFNEFAHSVNYENELR
ncbi:MAG: hypothetical protein RIQ33_856 [Bacteroidota bacterium]|jgi:AAA15 family ATPase/GTPase